MYSLLMTTFKLFVGNGAAHNGAQTKGMAVPSALFYYYYYYIINKIPLCKIFENSILKNNVFVLLNNLLIFVKLEDLKLIL